ncbi:CHY zinc finger protein [Microbacterium sp. RD1]|uniref:CHY zinc finger protein n=1 Tax=Microbacterium sp. RD1 TaxID=3457313 RepID=UPI003FA5FA42
MIVHGQTVDDQTRCVHYATELDVIAIRFACCDRWYPCHACHAASESHPGTPWPRDAFGEHAVLCGVCRTQFTIDEYLAVKACPTCSAGFNPGCRLHHDLYFTR